MKKLWLCLSVVFASQTFAGVGTVTEQANVPGSITRSNNTTSATKGVGVEMNDTIKTTKGKIGITFKDDTKVEVNPSSKLVIDDFVYDPKSSKGGKLAMKFAQGTVKYASGQVAKNNPQAVAINTPSATIAVRGTDFTATVDEMGASTIILLPSCPKKWVDVERDCKTGIIDVINDAGIVTLNRPFEGTKVQNRATAPLKPTVLNLTPDAISNLLIVAPPKEIKEATEKAERVTFANNSANMLNVNFLKQDFLKNEFEKENTWGSNPLEQKLLEQQFLANIFDILAMQLEMEQKGFLENLLAEKDSLLPDYKKETGVVKSLDVGSVSLCRSDGSNIQCVNTPKTQNTTILQIQGEVSIRNRVNQGGNSFITLRQN